MVRIPEVMWDRIENYALRRGIRPNEALRMILTKELDEDGA